MLEGLRFTPFDAERMEEVLSSYLTDLPILTQRHPAQTRRLLRQILPCRIGVWREGAVGRLFRPV
jgi:hypothetical protein